MDEHRTVNGEYRNELASSPTLLLCSRHKCGVGEPAMNRPDSGLSIDVVTAAITYVVPNRRPRQT